MLGWRKIMFKIYNDCWAAHMRSAQKVPSHVIWQRETFIVSYTRYKKYYTYDNDTSVPFKWAPWDLTQFSQSPWAAPLYFPESHQWSEISSLSNVILVFGKARSCRLPNLGCNLLNHPGDLIFHKKPARNMMQEWACCHNEAANHQLPIAMASWIIQMVSMEEGSSLIQNLMQICYSAHSVILNATATKYTCLPMAPLMSTVKSALFTHGHSSPLSLASRLHQPHANHSHYINIGWTFSRQTSYMGTSH